MAAETDGADSAGVVFLRLCSWEAELAAVEASASQPEVNEDALNTMLATGLQLQHCVAALRRCKGDANAATEFCLRSKA